MRRPLVSSKFVNPEEQHMTLYYLFWACIIAGLVSGIIKGLSKQ